MPIFLQAILAGFVRVKVVILRPIKQNHLNLLKDQKFLFQRIWLC